MAALIFFFCHFSPIITFMKWLITFFGLLFTQGVFANLQVFPTRLLIEEKKRIGQLSLRHTGTTPEKYKISAIYYKMKPDGGLELATKPEEPKDSAFKMIRFSPREVTLQPNLEQVLRIMVIRPADLPEGDYRAHILFEPTTDDSATDPNADPTKVSMKLSVKVAVAIPIIVKKGNLQPTVTLEAPSIMTDKEAKRYFTVTMKKSGPGVTYGDFFVSFKDKDGNSKEIAIAKGVSMYVDERKATYPLSIEPAVALNNGTLKVEYKSSEEDGGKLVHAVEATLK